MLKPALLHRLRLPAPVGNRQQHWLSAASGLVCVDHEAYVVADDELYLHRFALDASSHQMTAESPLRLFAGELPDDPSDRKREKPDLESLMLLPATADLPHGALLTLGSGSKSSRYRAVMLPLAAGGKPSGTVLQRTLEPLYEKLYKHFADLNIEGAFVHEGRLRLLQRGNKGKSSQSAVLHFDAADFAAWLLASGSRPPKLQALTELDFGSAQGVPLCPTDGTALPDGRWLATLVAEDTDNSYHDGCCVASAVAILDAKDQLTELQLLDGSPKVEGIALPPGPASARQHNVLVVTDPDNRALPAELLGLNLPSVSMPHGKA